MKYLFGTIGVIATIMILAMFIANIVIGILVAVGGVALIGFVAWLIYQLV